MCSGFSKILENRIEAIVYSQLKYKQKKDKAKAKTCKEYEFITSNIEGEYSQLYLYPSFIEHRFGIST